MKDLKLILVWQLSLSKQASSKFLKNDVRSINGSQSAVSLKLADSPQ